MRIVGVILVAWLLIGVIAAAQRDFFSNNDTNCAHVGRTIATILVGPLNYTGVNLKVDCHLPQPSK
jgi:hypothetical protein